MSWPLEKEEQRPEEQKNRNDPAKITPVMGTNNLARISALSDALKVELDRQDWFYLYEAALGNEVP